jgi:hypothetical protein
MKVSVFFEDLEDDTLAENAGSLKLGPFTRKAKLTTLQPQH